MRWSAHVDALPDHETLCQLAFESATDRFQTGKNDASKDTSEMTQEQPNNLLHGVTLEAILRQLVAHYGWPELGRQIDIRCFNHEPSISSSLKFLRRTPWARERVESLYLYMLRSSQR